MCVAKEGFLLFFTPMPSNAVVFISACERVFVCAASFINDLASLNQFLHRGRRHAGYRTSTPSHVLGDGSLVLFSSLLYTLL